MTEAVQWQQLYQAAMLELNPAELHVRIARALQAMREREEQLTQSNSRSLEERRAIADALHSLATLERVEHRSTVRRSVEGSLGAGL